MKVIIDIPKEFERHFNNDKFKDSLERIECDIQDDINKEHTIPTVSGRRELELLDMLVATFEKAEVFHSTCTLEGIPVYKMNCDDIWNAAYDERDGVTLND